MNSIAKSVLCLLILLLGVGGGCSLESKLASNSDLSGGLSAMQIRSPAFRDDHEIPKKFTAEGENISPPIRWSKGPSGVKEFLLIVEDVDAKTPHDREGRPAVHWMVYNIPASVTELPEGASRGMTLPEGKNYLGDYAYAGPKPPKGKKHTYYFQIFALDTVQNFPPGLDRDGLAKLFVGNVLTKGVVTGTYGGEPEK